MKKCTLALAGNPNSGKTLTFNGLTHLNQQVANYPGVTVEQKKGYCRFCDCEIEVVDLPGIYGLMSMTEDERVARDFILEQKPDVVVNIIDSENLERSLYLTLQLLELQVPVLVCLNMYQAAEKKGIRIDAEKISGLLGVPVLKYDAKSGEGVTDIVKRSIDMIRGNEGRERVKIRFEEGLDTKITALADLLKAKGLFDQSESYPYWQAIKMLEGDDKVMETVTDDELLDLIFEFREQIGQRYGEECETVFAQARYAQIAGIVAKVQKQQVTVQRNFSETLDKILLNRTIGLPVFFVVMWIVFQLVFWVSAIPTDWIRALIAALGSWLSGWISNELISSMLVDGVLGGVGGVLAFIPQILLLFMALAILEDSGYMARAAFLMDRWMHKIGLHGKSFVPMILGFGCSVPAIMATRTLTTRKEKILTCLMVPFISCSARMPVYGLLIGAFFAPGMGGNILFSLYLVGILSAIFLAKLLGKYLIHGPQADFVLELPVYRLPTAHSIFLYTWFKLKHYLLKAGTVILAASVLVWAATSFPRSAELQDTFAGHVGRILEPVLRPLGFNWQISIALVIGFSAKELVISTLSTIYHVADSTAEGLGAILYNDPSFSPLVAYVLMLFVLLYTPCLATVAIIKQEIGSKWAFISVLLSTSWAWLVCFLVYQVGSFLGY